MPTRKKSIPLDGEDIKTLRWQDARHWISIYDDLIRFKQGVLERVEMELAKLPLIAQEAAAEDLAIITTQMDGYYARLDLWHQRLWELQGLHVDPESRSVRHMGKQELLTGREFQLLQFLLNHPHRFFTADQIMGQAWADPALFPEEVRNYILRIRRILVKLDLPYDLVNQPRRGYSLVIRATT
jgi:hypothetical protein